MPRCGRGLEVLRHTLAVEGAVLELVNGLQCLGIVPNQREESGHSLAMVDAQVSAMAGMHAFRHHNHILYVAEYLPQSFLVACETSRQEREE